MSERRPGRRRVGGVARRASPQTEASEELLFHTEEYSGPVPPVDLVDGYQRLIPNGGERLLAMAEAEGDHRRSMEKRQLNHNFIAHVLGQTLGFVLAAGVIFAGAYLIDHGHSVA